MGRYRKNYISKHHISVSDMNDLIKIIEEKQLSYQTVVSNVAGKVADEMLNEVLSGKYTAKDGNNPYRATQKEVKTESNKATAIIRNNENKALFYEMGTGVVGADNPATKEYTDKYGWIYDHNEHGEAGWVYPKEDGTWGRTSGLRAMNGFYNASKLAKEKIKDITLEELKKM